MKKVGYTLLGIISGSFLFKAFILVLLIHSGSTFMQPDSLSYLAPAIHAVHGGSLWLNASLWMRTPGYPLFLATIFKVFGIHLVTVIVIQLLLSSLLIINAYRIGTILRNSTGGLWCAALVSMDYLLIDVSNFILSDFLFSVIFSFAFYYLIVFMKIGEKHFQAVLMLGLLLAMATWVRPLSYYFLPLLVMMLLGYAWRTKQLGRMMGWMLLLVIPSLILVGSWQIRNKEVIGTYRYTGIDAINFYRYYGADILAHEKHIAFEEAQAQLDRQASNQHLTGLPLNDYYRHEGLNILLHHPLLMTQQMLIGAFHILMSVDSGIFYQTAPSWQHHQELRADLYHGQLTSFFHHATGIDYVKFALIGLFYGINLFLIAGVIYFIRHSLSSETNRSTAILCLIVMGYFLLLSSNVCSYGRFKVPFEVMLDCFAVLGVTVFFKRHDTLDTTA